VAELAKAKNPGFILLDLTMPRQDGMTALEQLKRDAATAEIPVVVCTVASDTENQEKAKALGALDYWVKPIDLGFFRRTLEGILGGPPAD